MSELRLKIEDAYLSAFWSYIHSLPNGSVEVIVSKTKKSTPLKGATPNNAALLKAAKPIRKGVTLAQLAQEQGYTKTNWQRVHQLAKDMAIQEPIEDLLAQLTP